MFPGEAGDLTNTDFPGVASELPRELREFAGSRSVRPAESAGSWLLDVSARVPATSEEIAGVRLAARRVRVRLEQGFAHSVIEEELVNETARELEGKIVFRLPPRAVLGQVALWVDGAPIEAAVVEKERGRAVYGAIVDVTRRDPVLVERQPSGRVALRVFPIPPRASRRVTYAYDEPLVENASGVRYRLPLALPAWAPALDELSLEIELAGASEPPVATNDRALRRELRAGRTALVRRARAVRPEDVEVTLPGVSAPKMAVSAPDAAPGGRVAALRFAQPRAAAESAPDAVAIVVDTSVGQRGAGLAESVRLARELVAGLERRQRFVLLGCDSVCAVYPSEGLALAQPDRSEAARDFLLALTADGASDLAGALAEAAARVGSAARAQLIAFGDAQASTGALVIGRAAPLRAHGLDVRLVGLGAGVEMSRLSRFAAELGAARLLVEPGDELGVERLRQWLAAPANPPSFGLPQGLGESAPSAPRVVAGDTEIVLARAGAGFRALPSAAGFEGPARLWASERMAELELAENGADARAIVELARRYGVLSERTSLIALDSAPAFERFGIVRHSSRAPTVRMGGTTVSGRLPPEAIQRTVREHFGRFRACYHEGLLRNPALDGAVLTRFLIGRDGSVQWSKSEGRELQDRKVIACVERAFAALRFTQPEGGTVMVAYPLRFSPDRSEPAPRALPSPVRRRQVPRAMVTDRRPAFEIVASSARERAEQDAEERGWTGTLREDVKATPRDASARRRLVRQLILSGRFAEAEDEATRFVAAFPVSLVALEAAADARLATLDVVGAAEALAAAVELEPLTVDRQRRAALAYETAGDEGRACAHFRAAAALAPSDLALRFEAFRCRAALGTGRLGLLAELDAVVAPTPELEALLRALTEQRALPSRRPPIASGFSARVECSAAPADCPTPLLITEDGEVIAPAASGARAASLHVAAPEGRMRLYLAGGSLHGASVLLSSGETRERRAASELAPDRRVELQFPN